MVYFVEGFVSILLQCEFGVACLALTFFGADHAYYQNLSYCPTFRTQTRCNVFWTACSWLYCFSPYHRFLKFEFRIIKSKRRSRNARGVGFEPTGPYGHGISNPTTYQARRPQHKMCSTYNCYYNFGL